MEERISRSMASATRTLEPSSISCLHYSLIHIFFRFVGVLPCLL